MSSTSQTRPLRLCAADQMELALRLSMLYTMSCDVAYSWIVVTSHFSP